MRTPYAHAHVHAALLSQWASEVCARARIQEHAHLHGHVHAPCACPMCIVRVHVLEYMSTCMGMLHGHMLHAHVLVLVHVLVHAHAHAHVYVLGVLAPS